MPLASCRNPVLISCVPAAARAAARAAVSARAAMAPQLDTSAASTAAAVAECRRASPLVQCITNFVSMVRWGHASADTPAVVLLGLAAATQTRTLLLLLILPPSPFVGTSLLFPSSSHTHLPTPILPPLPAGHHGQHAAGGRRLARHGARAGQLCAGWVMADGGWRMGGRGFAGRGPGRAPALQACLPADANSNLPGTHWQAHSIGEVEDFVGISSALLINVGTLSDGKAGARGPRGGRSVGCVGCAASAGQACRRPACPSHVPALRPTPGPDWVGGMKLGAKAAAAKGKPWVLDPVGCGATPYRSQVCLPACLAGGCLVLSTGKLARAVRQSPAGVPIMALRSFPSPPPTPFTHAGLRPAAGAEAGGGAGQRL